MMNYLDVTSSWWLIHKIFLTWFRLFKNLKLMIVALDMYNQHSAIYFTVRVQALVFYNWYFGTFLSQGLGCSFPSFPVGGSNCNLFLYSTAIMNTIGLYCRAGAIRRRGKKRDLILVTVCPVEETPIRGFF